MQETKVHKEEVAKSERRGSLKGWEADEPVPNNKTHKMAMNRLEHHTRKSKHKTKIRLTDFLLNLSAFVGYRSKRFFLLQILTFLHNNEDARISSLSYLW